MGVAEITQGDHHVACVISKKLRKLKDVDLKFAQLCGQSGWLSSCPDPGQVGDGGREIPVNHLASTRIDTNEQFHPQTISARFTPRVKRPPDLHSSCAPDKPGSAVTCDARRGPPDAIYDPGAKLRVIPQMFVYYYTVSLVCLRVSPEQTDAQNLAAVTAHLKSEQLLLLGLSRKTWLGFVEKCGGRDNRASISYAVEIKQQKLACIWTAEFTNIVLECQKTVLSKIFYILGVIFYFTIFIFTKHVF